MTVTAIEILAGSVATNGTGAPTITTSLLATDRVVVVVTKTGPSGTPAVSGLGATWVEDASAYITRDLYIFSTSGVTGGGTLAITGYAFAGAFAVYVLRSDVATTPYLTATTAGQATSQVAGVPWAVTPSATAEGNSIVIAAGSVNNGPITFPASGSAPASGWTTDYLYGTTHVFVHRLMTATETINLSVVSTVNYSGVIARCIYWDGTSPTVLPPLTSTFVGWGNPIF